MSKRKRSIEIYLKEGIDEEDAIFGIWENLREYGRGQDLFRRAIRFGLRIMVDNGELPKFAFEKVDPNILGRPPARAAAKPRGRPPKERTTVESQSSDSRPPAKPEAFIPVKTPEPVRTADPVVVTPQKPIVTPPPSSVAQPGAGKGRLGRLMG